MSDGTDVFVKGKYELEQIVELLSSILSISFIKLNLSAGVLYRSSYKDMEIDVFGDHGFVDDCYIKFSQFDYVISIDTIFHIEDEYLEIYNRQSLCREIAYEIKNKLGGDFIIVESLQEMVYPSNKLSKL